MAERYPGYDVLAKWRSPSFDDTTRAVLRQRLATVPARRFLAPAEWELLEALAARLMPQPDRAEPIPITPWIDAMLVEGVGDGYRRDGWPGLRETWRMGLAAIEDEARIAAAGGFAAMDADAQDALLARIQRGEVRSPQWQQLPPAHFFGMLLRTVAAIYYSHPAAWSEIGFGGPASPRGYVRLGFDEQDPWEAHDR